MKGRKSGKQKRKTRRISAVMFAMALAASLVLSTLLHAVAAQAEPDGCEITLTPSAPAADNNLAGVYGCYNADSDVSVDILVQAAGKDVGIRRIEYWITDGAENEENAVLYEDLYVEELAEVVEPIGEDAVDGKASERPEEKKESEAPEEPEQPEEPEAPEEPAEPETPNEPEAPNEPEEPDESEDPMDPDGGEEEDEEAGDAEESEQTEDFDEDNAEEDEEDDADGAEREEDPESPEGEKTPEKDPEGSDGEERSEEDGEGKEEPDEPEESEKPDEPDEADEPEEPREPDEPNAPEEPRGPEEPKETEESKEPEATKEPTEPEESEQTEAPELSEEPKEPVPEREAHPFLESWEGSVTVDTARYHTGEVRVHVKATDSAGAEREAEVRLDIDVVAPEVQITGVSDQHAYRGNVAPKIQIHDANFTEYEVSLTRTRMDEVDVDVTERFFTDRKLAGEGGDLMCKTIERVRDNDGIYTLRAKAMDLAGNTGEASVTFSVNRFGSVYVFSDYLISLIQNGGVYAREIEQDLVITEYNANRLMPGSLLIDITRDARPMTGVISDLTPAISDTVATGASGWFEYQYTLDRDNFASDGIYKISLSSEDEAGNTPDNVEATGAELLFRVDGTEPEITGGAKTDENGGLAEGENFSYNVYDTIGLGSVEVYVDGELYDDAVTDFGEDANNYSGTLSLPAAASEQEVRLVATDRAGNIADTSFAAPGRTRILQDLLRSPATALKQLAQEGILLPVLVGAAAAAAVILTLFLLRAWRVKGKK